MTTKDTPVARLRAQAEKIARTLRTAERAGGNGKTDVVFGVAMDDKFLKVTMTWAQVRETSVEALAEYIVGLMQERDKRRDS